jgi:hypothetical protein
MGCHIRFLLVLLLAAEAAIGATITVRKDGTGDYAVIQQALDVAAAGDTILIGPGEYLDHSTVRLPGWNWDIEVYAYVTVDDLTIIGAGADQTFIGPAVYSGVYGTFTPEAMTYLNGASIRLSDLCLRNSWTGLDVKGTLYMDRCSIYDNRIGTWWHPLGAGGWVKDTQFDAFSYTGGPIALDVGSGDMGSDILVDNCQFGRSKTIVRGVDGCRFRNCDFANGKIALQICFTAYVYVESCRIASQSVAGVELTLGSNAVCEISDSEVAGAQSTLSNTQTGGRFIVEKSRLEGGTFAILAAYGGPGSCAIHNSDLIKSSGPAVYCGDSEPAVVHDLRNNYWGTTRESDIQSWIIDSNDDPNIHATVLYTPFAGQSVPSETTTWGDLKALFR